MRSDDERACIVRAIEGDTDAFGKLVERYNKAIYGYLYRLTLDHHDADDLSQDVFINAFRAINAFRKGTNFKAWLYVIARNRYLNFLRETARRKPRLETAAEAPAAGPASRPEGDLEERERNDEINTAIQALPEEQKQVVILHIIEGLSHGEIARIMNRSEETIRWRLFEARKKLVKRLGRLL